MYYFDTKIDEERQTCTNGNTTECKYGWLYDRTSSFCEDYGCLNNSNQIMNGYWTISLRVDSTTLAWVVYYSGSTFGVEVTNSSNYGIRPVIEILKSKLN